MSSPSEIRRAEPSLPGLPPQEHRPAAGASPSQEAPRDRVDPWDRLPELPPVPVGPFVRKKLGMPPLEKAPGLTARAEETAGPEPAGAGESAAGVPDASAFAEARPHPVLPGAPGAPLAPPPYGAYQPPQGPPLYGADPPGFAPPPPVPGFPPPAFAPWPSTWGAPWMMAPWCTPWIFSPWSFYFPLAITMCWMLTPPLALPVMCGGWGWGWGCW